MPAAAGPRAAASGCANARLLDSPDYLRSTVGEQVYADANFLVAFGRVAQRDPASQTVGTRLVSVGLRVQRVGRSRPTDPLVLQRDTPALLDLQHLLDQCASAGW